MTTMYVYALADPDEPDVPRYIGHSGDPKDRLMHHMCDCPEWNQSARCQWIRAMREAGKRPLVIVLDSVEWDGGMNPACDVERAYITRYADTKKLVNTQMNPHQKRRPEGVLRPDGSVNIRWETRARKVAQQQDAARRATN